MVRNSCSFAKQQRVNADWGRGVPGAPRAPAPSPCRCGGGRCGGGGGQPDPRGAPGPQRDPGPRGPCSASTDTGETRGPGNVRSCDSGSWERSPDSGHFPEPTGVMTWSSSPKSENQGRGSGTCYAPDLLRRRPAPRVISLRQGREGRRWQPRWLAACWGQVGGGGPELPLPPGDRGGTTAPCSVPLCSSRLPEGARCIFSFEHKRGE